MPLNGFAAPPVVLVFGLDDRAARWLTHSLRAATPPVVAVHLRPGLSSAAAHSVVSAVDAGVHVVDAAQGMDATFLEYWQLLIEMGKARFVAVTGLGPATLEVGEVSAIATRVLDEEVLPASLPLLDDDEAIVGVLDVASGEQWFPDGTRQPPRTDFVEAVELETAVLLEESDGEVLTAVRSGQVAVAATIAAGTGAGVGWLAAHMPDREMPAATTVLPGDDEDVVLVAAGTQGLDVGPALAVSGTQTQRIRIASLADPLEPGLHPTLLPGRVATARSAPLPATGALLVGTE